jgi:hypothetical protein
MRHHPFLTVVLALSVAVLAVGCTSKSTVPDAQQTSGVQPRMDQTTISGCLRSGDADGTFVLTSQAAESAKAATYHLTGNDRVNLRDYVGQQVEVSGVVRSEQEVTSSSGATPEKAAKGTSGTPTVETKTDLDVRQLDVNTVRPTGSKCEQ